MRLQYVLTHVSGAKISCFCRFRAGIYQFMTTDLRLAEQIKYTKAVFIILSKFYSLEIHEQSHSRVTDQICVQIKIGSLKLLGKID